MSTAVAAAVLAVGIPTAHADVLNLPAHEQTITMPDGWQLTVGHRDESANRVPPLNSIGSTREVFVTNQAYGKLAGAGSKLKGVILQTGYHLGCAVNITNVQVGATFSAGFTPGVIVSPVTVVPGIGIAPTPSITGNIGPTASIAPTFNVTLTPGQVVDLPMGKKTLEGPEAFVTNRDAHVKLDGCVGPASIRSYAIVAAQSATADDSVAVYGDPIAL